ncbi:ABC transporter ATP-binding protein/permease [Actinocorallia sp. API 0066]|uniref:ABC transporter ATP-binding protein n=1 Tax=Actinocorallia sp. API 0066 TaxID=2896846 RepID=UPI001E627575|nr:ABC transporter ATP-binding protein [Actinocorallia sp. API 0066]MCD0447942.1 ABC transporter ATP-binding protein/permease [Actinocorallia sp. API 0066]
MKLPVARGAQVKAYARRLVLRYPGPLARTVALHALATASGLTVPWLFAQLVADPGRRIDAVAAAIAAFVVLQALLTRAAFAASAALGERVLADLREEFVARALRLPLSTVERAGTGDLLARSSRDVDLLEEAVRDAVPQVLVSAVTVLFTGVALALTAPPLLLPVLAVVPLLWLSTRWYLRRALRGYLTEEERFAQLLDGFTETVTGARTVAALGREEQRARAADDAIRASWTAEKYTLGLRQRWYPVLELSYALPVVGTLLFGGFLYLDGHASLAQVTAATLYVQQLGYPLSVLLMRLDEFQLGAASLARLLGVADVPPDRSPTGAEPSDARLSAREVRYAYADRDVLHGVDLDLRPGETLAVVGPSGAGKSTLGRLLAGIDGPRAGRVTLGEVPLTDLPLDTLRHRIALVTQEHHVFRTTLRENLTLVRDAPDEELRAALDVVGWAGPGLDEVVGSGGHTLSPAQAQQVALARLVLADPHTLVLDEATSLLDPGAARALERSLGAVLRGRTVVAIAHRLHTAHDADRVAVVEDGRVTELGTHDELVARGGSYADLWSTWTR